MPTLEPFSSDWWLERLGKELDAREARMRKLQDYYDGRQVLMLVSDKFRQSFGATYAKFADNYCRLVVQALEERLTVTGFRFGDLAGDRKAWRLWQDNQLDAQSQKAHRESIIKGDCALIVGPGPTGPIVRAQKPEEVVVAYDDDPLVRAVAMKRWKDAQGRLLATLYFPDRIEKYQQTRRLVSANQYGRNYDLGGWEPRIVAGEEWPLLHDLGVVPVVPLINDPDLANAGTSEIQSVLPLQDALNKLMVDMLVASEFASFRQRWVTGMEIPVDPLTQKPIEMFKAAVDRVWQARDPNVKFGDFDQSDLKPYVSAMETVIQHMATTTRTPAHYLLGQSGTFPSGESLKATETGLVAKAKRRMRDHGETWEEVMRLAFRAAGDNRRATYTAAETIWRDPEYRTEAEHIDALVKLGSIGVPNEQLWEDAGYSPTQIERFKTMPATPPATLRETAPNVTPADVTATTDTTPAQTPPPAAAA